VPPKKHIIIIGVLCVISLGLGYWYGMPKEGSGGSGGNGDPKPPEFLKQSLVAYYPFNGNAKDESNNSNDFTVKGATLTKDRHGKTDRAYAFDGVNAYMEAPNHASLQLTQYSLSAWVSVNTPKEERRGRFILIKDKHIGENYSLTSHSDGVTSRFYYDDDGRGLSSVGAQEPLPRGTHFMVVGTKDNESMKIYIDGKLENELETQYVPDIDQQPLFLGYDGGYSYKKFHGTIDDVRIYNRALSEAEVKELYEFEKPKTQQASAPTSTKVVPQNPIADPIVEKAIRERRRKPTGVLTKVDLEQVVYLDLTSTKITDASLTEVAKLTQLKSLYLNDTKITDVGIKKVAEMKQLTTLYFKDTQATDVGVKEVAKMKQLTKLDLRATKVTKAVVRQLQKALPKCKIYSNTKK